jgi:oligopeptide transport system substrate-binding protein
MKIFCIALMLAAGLASCKSKPQDVTSRPLAGGINAGGTFRANCKNTLSTLDPVRLTLWDEVTIAAQVYSSLIRIDPETLLFKPQLAASWSVSPDGLVYTFHLRTDVRFQDDACFPNGIGKRLTSADVLYSLTRCLDARSGSRRSNTFTPFVAGAEKFFNATLQALKTKSEPAIKSVEGFDAPNDTTFIIRLENPYAAFLYQLASGGAFITCREAVTYYGGDLSRHPIGTGAFKLGTWREDDRLELVRNPTYFQKDSLGNLLPYLDAVTFRFIRDLNSQFLEFKTGTLEACDGLPLEAASSILDDDGHLKLADTTIVLKTMPQLANFSLVFLTTEDPFRNVKLRQAISSAIDRKKIASYVLKNLVTPAIGLVPKGIAGYNDSALATFDFDLVRAKKLLAEAGYPNGNGLAELDLYTYSGANYNRQIGESIQAMLREIGVRVKLVQVEAAQYFQLASTGKLNLFVSGWTDDPEPSLFLRLLYGKLVPKKQGDVSFINESRFQSEAFDSLYALGVRTQEQQRYALYVAAERAALAEAPLVPLYYAIGRHFERRYVKGFVYNPSVLPAYETAWLDK